VPAAALLAELSRSGIVGGLDLSADYPELGNALLVCATECRTDKEMQDYSRTAARILDDLTRNGGADA
jgi:glycine dehydrogenase subunit 1